MGFKGLGLLSRQGSLHTYLRGLGFHTTKKCISECQPQKWTHSSLARYCSNSTDRKKPLGGYEYEEEIQPYQIVNIDESCLELIKKENDQKLNIGFEWLRENCRCDLCYNGTTNQRSVLIFDVPSKQIYPESQSLSGNTLYVQWMDGHISEYAVDWLLAQGKLETRPGEILWSGDISKKVEYVTASQVKSEDGIIRLLKSLLVYGVGFVTNVEPNLKATKEVIQCVGQIQQTLFGGMWEFSDKMDHLDTAYTNQALDVHTDTSYFIEPAGLIVFHCTKRNCDGGNTLLVDGFRAAREVELETPELYYYLKTVYTEFQYIENDNHLTSFSTMIHHNLEDNIKQIRYNLYDRSPRVPFPASQSSLFYKGVQKLAAAVSKPENQWNLLLKPGTVAFINNWRVLHGRSAYLGQRSLCGAYVAMGDVLSRARYLRLIQ